MLKKDHMIREGNDKYEGFACDLIERVSSDLDFKFKIHLVRDGKFGSKMDNGTWNGMIGELLSGVTTLCTVIHQFMILYLNKK